MVDLVNGLCQEQCKICSAEDLAEIREQEELLKENINRMCVADSLQELVEQKNFAEFRIARIMAINYNRLTESEDEI